MQQIAANLVAHFVNKSLFLLRNRKNISLSREEIRSIHLSFSQFGEDLVIINHFRNFQHSQGVYIDVGAYDPISLSNTLLLKKLGWRGINVDMDDKRIQKFCLLRPDDHNVVAAIARDERVVKLMRYAQGVTDRIIDVSENVEVSVCGEEAMERSYVETKTLTSIIESSPFQDSKIHYLNIDCEGMDFEVLMGLDFDRYQPDLISIECHDEQTLEKIETFLSPYGYKLSDKVHLTVFFKQIDSF